MPRLRYRKSLRHRRAATLNQEQHMVKRMYKHADGEYARLKYRGAQRRDRYG